MPYKYSHLTLDYATNQEVELNRREMAQHYTNFHSRLRTQLCTDMTVVTQQITEEKDK